MSPSLLDDLRRTHPPDVVRDALGVLLPGFGGTDLPAWAAELLPAGLAGLFLFGHNVDDAAQVRALADRVHAESPGALLASDEEGGTVTRLLHREGSPWPGHRALGRVDDTDLTARVATELGSWADECGVDLVAAPCVDVDDTADNPVIGVRSFGGDPALVARHGVAFAQGLAAVDVLACAKHYPGHGATHQDSHLTLPTVADDLATVRGRDLAPFAAVIEAGVPVIMSAHVVHAALDDRAATLSPRVVRVLREDLGFSGVLCSDALDMHAIAHGVGREQGAVLALAAGVDLLCVGNPVHPRPYDAGADTRALVSAICRATEVGELSPERLAEAGGRVRALGERQAQARTAAAPPVPVSPGPSARQTRAGTEAARRAVVLDGPVPDLGGAVVRAASSLTSSIASGARQEVVVQALVGSLGLTGAEDGGGPLVLVTDDSVDGTAGELHRAAVVVHTGSRPLAVPRGCALVRTFGGGAAAGVAAAHALTAGRSRA